MFDKIMFIIFRHEGGYVNDPDDLGGETNFGISKYSHPNVDIKNLTKEKAKEIYYNNYFVPMEINKIDNINLALQYMDMGVNAGIPNAKKLMEQAKKLKAGGLADSLLEIFKQLRIDYYKDISKYRNNKKYLAGWLNRVNSNIA